MSVKTGKGGAYRYYTCSNRRRKGRAVCTGEPIRADLLKEVVGEYVEDRLLNPRRLEAILGALLDRRLQRVAERRTHAAELAKRAADVQQRLGRLYEAIESGVADIDDPNLAQRIAALKASRDQANADVDRAKALLDSSGSKAIPKQNLADFANEALKSLRENEGRFRRAYFHKFAQRVEVHRRTIKMVGNGRVAQHTGCNPKCTTTDGCAV